MRLHDSGVTRAPHATTHQIKAAQHIFVRFFAPCPSCMHSFGAFVHVLLA
jgi:hypothetical protein